MAVSKFVFRIKRLKFLLGMLGWLTLAGTQVNAQNPFILNYNNVDVREDGNVYEIFGISILNPISVTIGECTAVPVEGYGDPGQIFYIYVLVAYADCPNGVIDGNVTITTATGTGTSSFTINVPAAPGNQRKHIYYTIESEVAVPDSLQNEITLTVKNYGDHLPPEQIAFTWESINEPLSQMRFVSHLDVNTQSRLIFIQDSVDVSVYEDALYEIGYQVDVDSITHEYFGPTGTDSVRKKVYMTKMFNFPSNGYPGATISGTSWERISDEGSYMPQFTSGTVYLNLDQLSSELVFGNISDTSVARVFNEIHEFDTPPSVTIEGNPNISPTIAIKYDGLRGPLVPFDSVWTYGLGGSFYPTAFNSEVTQLYKHYMNDGPIGGSSTSTFFIKNQEVDELNVADYSFQITGIDSTYFSIIEPVESTIAEHDSVSFHLRFTPDSSRTYSATLNVLSAETDIDYSFPIYGTGFISTNIAPSFSDGDSTSITVIQDAGATSIDNLLIVSDPDSGQTLTWSINTSPSNGTLAGFPLNLSSTEGGISPSGLTYTPAGSYEGTDSFVIQVSDGIFTDQIRVNVTSQSLAKSISFDGADDFIQVPNSSELEFSEGTFELWLKPENYGNIDGGFLAMRTGPTVRFSFHYNPVTGTLGLWDGANYSTVAINLDQQKWNHIALAISGTGVEVYHNGVSKGSTLNTIVSGSTGLPLVFGAPQANSTFQMYEGKMDEVRLWNTVRTPEEIRQYMFQILSGDEDGLIAYWPFDEGTGATTADMSSSEMDAAINGSTWSNETAPYGTFLTGNEGWRMLSAPGAGISYAEILDTLWTQGFTGADTENGTPNVYTWKESAQTFEPVTNANEVPEAGFLVYVFDDDDYNGTADGFPKMVRLDSAQFQGSVFPTLSYTDTDSSAIDGWNLVGNPYGFTIDWNAPSGLLMSNLDASFYVWSDSANGGTGSYLSWNGSTGTLGRGEIAPMQGFWVKANAASPRLSFGHQVRGLAGILLKELPTPEVRFKLSDGHLSNSTIVMFDEQASMSKDPLDAYKLQSLNQDYLSIFTQNAEGEAFDLNALPLKIEGELSIPVDVGRGGLLSQNTDYKLSWETKSLPEGWSLRLIDNHTGIETILNEEESINFELESIPAAKKAEVEENDFNIPKLALVSPQVLKTKSKQSRFTLIISTSGTVSAEPSNDLPKSLELEQNYPNPFNPSTTISYKLPVKSTVDLRVFDMLGREVATLVNGVMEAGYHQVNFNASNLASGMYIYRLKAGNQVFTKKLTLIK